MYANQSFQDLAGLRNARRLTWLEPRCRWAEMRERERERERASVLLLARDISTSYETGDQGHEDDGNLYRQTSHMYHSHNLEDQHHWMERGIWIWSLLLK